MMHQGNHLVGRRQRLRRIGEHAEGKPVDHDRPARRHRAQAFERVAARACIGIGKTVAEIDDVDLAAEPAQARR